MTLRHTRMAGVGRRQVRRGVCYVFSFLSHTYILSHAETFATPPDTPRHDLRHDTTIRRAAGCRHIILRLRL